MRHETEICPNCQQPLSADNSVVTWEGIEVDLLNGTLTVDGYNPVHIPRIEAEVLASILSCKGRVATKLFIIERVYGLDREVEEKIIDVYICKLRKRLPSHVKINTLWCRGYTIRKEKRYVAANDNRP